MPSSTNSQLFHLCIGTIQTQNKSVKASFTLVIKDISKSNIVKTFCKEAESGYNTLEWDESSIKLDITLLIDPHDLQAAYKIYVGQVNKEFDFVVLASSVEACKNLLNKRLQLVPKLDFTIESVLGVRNWHMVQEASGQPVKKIARKYVSRILECVSKVGNTIQMFVCYKPNKEEYRTDVSHKLFVIEDAS